MQDKYKYLLKWVDHFSKYVGRLELEIKKQFLFEKHEHKHFNWFPNYLQSDNGDEFTNQTLETDLENIEREHILR